LRHTVFDFVFTLVVRETHPVGSRPGGQLHCNSSLDIRNHM
jgi:hypothetical protein